jgi:hypothetical protein
MPLCQKIKNTKESKAKKEQENKLSKAFVLACLDTYTFLSLSLSLSLFLFFYFLFF